MSETKTTEPTWGYKRGGQKRLFAAGEIMPSDWSTTIPEGEHPHDAEQGRFPPKDKEPNTGVGTGLGTANVGQQKKAG